MGCCTGGERNVESGGLLKIVSGYRQGELAFFGVIVLVIEGQVT